MQIKHFSKCPDRIYGQYGWSGWRDFLNFDLKQEVIDKAHEIFKRAKERGCLPQQLSSDSQEKQDARWLSRYRQVKQGRMRGILYPELQEAAKQYGFPGAFEVVDRKHEAIQKAHKVFMRAEKRGYLPKQHSKDLQECRDANWIRAWKAVKCGKSKRNKIWYPELQKIAKGYGFPKAFEIINLEQQAIQQACAILARARKRGRLPNSKSGDVQERADAEWLIARRQAEKNSNGYPGLKKVAKKYGFPTAFEIVDLKQQAIQRAHMVFAMAKDRGHLPRNSSTDLQERQDAYWIGDLKKAKQGIGSCIWYPGLVKIAKQYGFSKAFETIDSKRRGIEEAHRIFARAKQRGCLPRYASIHLQEKQDASWISVRRSIKNGKHKGNWHVEYIDIAKQYGFPGVFEVVDRRHEAIQKAHRIFARARNKGKLPKHGSADLQERQDASWISVRRKIKNGRYNGKWYPEWDDIIKQYGFPNAFNRRGLP